MEFNEMFRAVQSARETIRIADLYIDQMADLIRGKLRSSEISGYTLEILKKELQDFDMRTGMWKER